MNLNFQEILTKNPSSTWECDTSGNIPPCGVALRRTCRCTEIHRVKNADLSPARNVLIHPECSKVADESCRQNQNTNLRSGTLFLEIVTFTRQLLWKMWQSHRGYRQSNVWCKEHQSGCWVHPIYKTEATTFIGTSVTIPLIFILTTEYT